MLSTLYYIHIKLYKLFVCLSNETFVQSLVGYLSLLELVYCQVMLTYCLSHSVFRDVVVCGINADYLHLFQLAFCFESTC